MCSKIKRMDRFGALLPKGFECFPKNTLMIHLLKEAASVALSSS